MRVRRQRAALRAVQGLLLMFTCCAPAPAAAQTSVPEDFTRFTVPGHEPALSTLRELYWSYYATSGPQIPVWDEWMPMSTLWPAREADPLAMRSRWAGALAGRSINAEGYVATQQHDGPAHAEGWPFPRWMEAGGVGWHFRGTGVAGYDGPRSTPEGWSLDRAEAGEVGDKGWNLALGEAGSTATSPAFSIDAKNTPWLRLNWWASGLAGADCYVEWTTRSEPAFSPDRRAYFSPPTDAAPKPATQSSPTTASTSARETRTMIPLYRVPTWKGTITRLRIGFDNTGPASVVIKSLHSACDTRQGVNNLNFIRGVHDYFAWTRDVAFLRGQIGRVRQAMRFVQREFDTRNRKCIYNTWPGQSGRSGVRLTNGVKQVVPGEGIGSNYWDLLPFGGEDALATIYYYDAIRDLAALEAQIAAHPQWSIAGDAFDAAELLAHAGEVKAHGGARFWNVETGRFGTIDLEGGFHDYGWTFLNNEAVHYDFATPEQARSIRDWISGRREVVGDTSRGADIYHWRFGPRASTRRNLDYYFWGWSNPEAVPWGNQVQDGGAVLGFSYHDLMCRIAVDGPDDAWRRLQEVLAWFADTQAAGGYRAYYAKDPARGTLQGANVAGGLGMDKEFVESILVPQVMLYGFLGFEPTPEGFKIQPRLPKDWPSLKVSRIHLHDNVLDVTAEASGAIVVEAARASDLPVRIELPPGQWRTDAAGAKVEERMVTLSLPRGSTRFEPAE